MRKTHHHCTDKKLELGLFSKFCFKSANVYANSEIKTGVILCLKIKKARRQIFARWKMQKKKAHWSCLCVIEIHFKNSILFWFRTYKKLCLPGLKSQIQHNKHREAWIQTRAIAVITMHSGSSQKPLSFSTFSLFYQQTAHMSMGHVWRNTLDSSFNKF